MSDSPVSILYDAAGNAVAVVLDNSIRRLETRSTLVGQQAGTGAEVKVTTIQDPVNATHKRLQVEADIKPGATISVVPATPDPDLIVQQFLTDDGTPAGSHDMIVNGSVTPVVFSFPADPVNDILVSEIRFVFSVLGTISFDGSSFGKGSGLTNGILFDATINNGSTTTLAEIFLNEGWLRLIGGTPFVDRNAANQVLAAAFQFGGRTLLKGGTSDEVRVTIRDNLGLGALGVTYLTATFYGTFE